MTIVLIIIISLVSVASFSNPTLMHQLMHYPYLEHKEKQYYRLFTGGLVHADWFHLGINMFVLYNFGELIESIFAEMLPVSIAKLAYLGLFVFCVVVGNVPSFLREQHNQHYSGVGASGATSGIVFTFILFYPFQIIYIYVLPVPGLLFAVLYLAYSSYAAKQQRDNIGHDAHFAGAIGGILYTLAVIPSTLSLFIDQISNYFGR